MKTTKLLFLIAMLLVGINYSYAQLTRVEFVAGIDKGYKTFAYQYYSGSDKVEKAGITMSSTNGAFAGEKYGVLNISELGQQLTFKSANKNIVSIEFEGGENINALRTNGFNSSEAKWTGRATQIVFDVNKDVLVYFSKVIVTLSQLPTTIEFAQPIVYNYIEQQVNIIPAPTVKSWGNVVSGLSMNYQSNNKAVADIIEADGKSIIVPKSEGSAVITAKFNGNNQYDSSEAQFMVKVVNGKNIFYESFNNVSGTGGNDGNFDYVSWDDKVNTGILDNTDWQTKGVGFLGSWAYSASQCVRLEMGASITTPCLKNLSGNGLLIFRAAQNRDATTEINLSISGGGSLGQEIVKLNGKEFAEYAILIKDGTPQTRITFNCSSSGSLYLDDVKVERAIVLDEATDNSSILRDNASMAEGATINIMLKRSLSSKCWNTFCLPFDIKSEDIETIFGKNTYIVVFDHWDVNENAVYFKEAHEIVAGTPCLIWPGEETTSIMVRNMIPTDKIHNVVSTGVSFKGVYSPTTISPNDVFLDPKDNKLDTPDEADGSNRIKGFDAYFSGLTDAPNAKLMFDGNINSISNIDGDKCATNNNVYSLDGKIVSTLPHNLKKGLYIVGGKKIIIK